MSNAANADLERLENELYRAPPKDFVAARDALVAAYKTAGKATEAKAAKALRRPMVPVWLWNRLILDEDADALAAVDIAGGLAHALARGAEGKHDLAEHTTGLRAAANAVVRNGRKLASASDVGFSNAQERELTDLVLALPWREAIRDVAARGRLSDLPEAVDPLEAMRALAAGEVLRDPSPSALPAKPKPKEKLELGPAANDDGEDEATKAATKAAQAKAAAKAREAMRAQLAAELDATQKLFATAERALAEANELQQSSDAEVRHAEKLLEVARANAKRAAETVAARSTERDELRDRRDAAKAALADA